MFTFCVNIILLRFNLTCKLVRTSPYTQSGKKIRLVSDTQNGHGSVVGLLNINRHYSTCPDDAKQQLYKLIQHFPLGNDNRYRNRVQSGELSGRAPPINSPLSPEIAPVGWFLLNLFLFLSFSVNIIHGIVSLASLSTY